MSAAPSHRAIEAIWRIESARIIGALTRVVRDVGVAEELAQDALVAALETWPRDGVPDKPAAWLTVAVDMPFVDELALERLVAGRDKTKMATCYYNRETRQPEPLLTLWESIAYNPLLSFAENGNISPREFLKTHPVKTNRENNPCFITRLLRRGENKPRRLFLAMEQKCG